MGFDARKVSVTTTATKIATGFDHSGGTSNASGVLVKNTHASATVYLGGATVTTDEGYPLAAGEALPVGDIGDGDNLYGIVASGTADVRVLEVA